NENTTAIILEEMRNLISAHLPDLQYSHYYQEALDAIGQWHLWRCEKDESLHQFSELMEVRRSFSATPMRWLRPPDKLGIFTLVRAARAPPSVLRTKRFTMVANYVEPLHATCGDRISVSDIKKLFESSYPDWLNADERKWYDGTVISTAHGELNTYILSILDTLWRT
ncbi:MAG: hypothetical protein ACQRW7_01620, partial [Caulobacterales bacterium]|uniref:hypothetical protein n=1 Tax=Glycocaulis sp. TaxID=1969725 RepID=UPI003FA0363C